MGENGGHFYNKSFVQKGRVLRNKCAQIKVQEQYLDKQQSLFLKGNSTFEPPIVSTFIVPSFECFTQFNPVLSLLPLSSGARHSNDSATRVPPDTTNETLLILQTVIRSALSSESASFQRKCKSLLYDTPSASRLIFLNEVSEETCDSSLETELQHPYQIRLFINACLFLSQRYDCAITVLVSDSHDPVYSACQSSCVHVESVKSYLTLRGQSVGQSSSVISNLILSANAILEQLYIINPARSDSSLGVNVLMDKSTSKSSQLTDGYKVKTNIYTTHLSASEIKIGLSNGSLMQGKIYVYTHNYLEAEVSVSGGRTVLISGRTNMNRALDGDIVVIKLHPQSVVRSVSLQSDVSTDGADGAEDSVEPATSLVDTATNIPAVPVGNNTGARSIMTTGMVVAIIRRDVTEIVVTVPMTEIESSKGSDAVTTTTTTGRLSSVILDKETFLLVSPTDMRLPKVRLRTRQKGKLEGLRIIVAFDDWPVDSVFPNCHFVRVIGEANDWKTEVESILIRHSIFPQPFSAAALACLPKIETNVLQLLGSDSSSDSGSGSGSSSGSQVSPVEVNSKSVKNKSGWKDSHWMMPTDDLTDLDPVLDLDPDLKLELELESGTVSGKNSSMRRDFRKDRRVFSVDPPGCQDIDDAMSVHWVSGEKGVIEVAVSIADVCAFLPQGCALDVEAQTRGTTVYLTHKRMDMLPSLISGDIASLHGEKDRFAVSVTWHIKVTHTDGRPVSPTEDPLHLYDNNDLHFDSPVVYSCGRTAIKNIAAMTYAQAHNLILGLAPDLKPSLVPPGQAGQNVPKKLWENLRSDLKMLTVFGRYLKSEREKNGALDLTQSGGELKFKLDSEGEPMDVNCKEEMEVHNTIAELMIVANSTVAQIISTYSPQETLVRIHSPPALSKQKEIMKFVLQTGQGQFDGDAPDELRDQLRFFREKMLFPKKKPGKVSKNDSNGIMEKMKNEENEDEKMRAASVVDLVTSSVIKSMCEALYVCNSSLSGNLFSTTEMNEDVSENRLAGHYGLGLAYYTHFTSPIRRYADIIVHRQLLAVLESLGGGTGLKRIKLPTHEEIEKIKKIKKLKELRADKFMEKFDAVQNVLSPELRNLLYSENEEDSADRECEAVQGVKNIRVADGRMNYEKVSSVSYKSEENPRPKIPHTSHAPDLSTENYPILAPAGAIATSTTTATATASVSAVAAATNDTVTDIVATTAHATAPNATSTTATAPTATAPTVTATDTKVNFNLDEDEDIMNALLESGPGSHPGSQVSPFIDENDFLNDLLGEPSSASVAISLPGTKNNYEDDDFLDGLLNDNFEEFNIDINTQINSVLDVGLSVGGAWDDTFISSLLNTDNDNNNLIIANENEIGNENENYFDDEKNKSNFNIHAPTASTQLTVTATDRVTSHKKIIFKKTENFESSNSQPYVQPVRAPGDAPYSADQVTAITAHLNIMNRRSKAVQMECQKMFLRLYFLTRVEEHDAIVYDIRDNGFLAYVPVYDFKGPVYLEKQGVIRLHPSLLGMQTVKTEGKGEGVGEGNSDKSDCTKYDRAILDFPDYECRLNRDENDSVKELLVCPKGYRNENYSSSNSGSGSGSGSGGEGRVLSILPLQRVRVAITSSSLQGYMNGGSKIRLTLINSPNSTPNTKKLKSDSKPHKIDEMQSNRLTEMVMQDSDKSTKAIIGDSNLSNTDKNTVKNEGDESLYLRLRNVLKSVKSSSAVMRDTEIRMGKERKTGTEAGTVARIKDDRGTKSGSGSGSGAGTGTLTGQSKSNVRQSVVSLRYELVGGGRVAFGPEEQIRFIFRLGRNKAIEIEKDQERRRELKELNGDNESHKERIPGDSLLMKMASKRGKNHSTSFDNFTTGGMNEEQKKELLENSLKDGKTAAMNKMALYGEEWAEEENLPESSENGSGMGADTVLGLKASNGGFGKEIAQANARQSKLRVAKKNSKY